MQERWAVMSSDGEWSRDEGGKVLTFFQKSDAVAHCGRLNVPEGQAGWTVEPFTVDDALEEAARSPFAGEGGL